MGWDRMVHRGLRNKWSDSPTAILLRLAGTIKHLNELNRETVSRSRCVVWSVRDLASQNSASLVPSGVFPLAN